MMIHGFLIVFLGALPLIFANPLPADSIDSEHPNQLIPTYLDPIIFSLVPDLGNQGSLPSVGLDASTHDSLGSITATDPAAIGSETSAGICESEGLQPGVKTNTKFRKREGGSCASQSKKSQPPTIAPPNPILIPNPGEQLLTFPPVFIIGDDKCKKPFVYRYCCDGPVGFLIDEGTHSTLPSGFYDPVEHCLDC